MLPTRSRNGRWLFCPGTTVWSGEVFERSCAKLSFFVLIEVYAPSQTSCQLLFHKLLLTIVATKKNDSLIKVVAVVYIFRLLKN
jgi:hypothetical protein